MVAGLTGIRMSTVRYLSSRASTIFLLGCMMVPLACVLQDSYEIDFRAFYVAAASAAKGLDPYVDNRAAGERFTDPISETEISRWVYPPSSLFLFAPFAKLRYTPARLLFDLLSLVSLGWVLLYLSDRFKVADTWLMACFVSLPVLTCAERGQVDLLVLFLLVLTYCLSYASGRPYLAGIPLGAAIAIKIFPGAVLLWFVLDRRLREATATLATLLAIVLLSAWRYGIVGYSDFWRNLSAIGPGRHPTQGIDLTHRYGGLVVDDHWLMLNHSFVGSYNNPLVLLGSAGIFVGTALAVAIGLLLRYKRVSPEIGFFTMVLASLLINTRLWTMGVVMYLPICIVLIGKARSTLTTFLLMLPLFVPAQVRFRGVSPRLAMAIGVVAFVIHRGPNGKTLPATVNEHDEQEGLLLPAL